MALADTQIAPEPGRILVVDDDQSLRGYLCAVLDAAGYATLEACDLEGAHHVLDDADTGLVCMLLDERLPDGRGVDLLGLLRSDPATQSLPVIMITGLDSSEDELAGFEAGATDYLVKPVDGDVLLARVARRIRDHVAMIPAIGDRAPFAPGDRAAHAASREEIADVIDRSAFAPVYQPIVDLESREEVGFEALTRFADGCRPDRRFLAAAAVGLGSDLELATLEAAVTGAHGRSNGHFLALNVTPSLLAHRVHDLGAQLARADTDVVLEITEQEAIDDYGLIRNSLATLQPSIRLSIDDAGAGFASLRHVVMLEPDFVKLDRSWVSGIEHRPAAKAMIAGLVHFAENTGCRLVAEGIETPAESDALIELGVGYGQGHLFGRPAPLAD